VKLHCRARLPITVWILASCGVLLPILPAASPDEEITAVFSKVVSKDYVRKKLPDGSYQPEEYSLKNGGRYGKHSGDGSIDKLGFPDIARVIVEQLGTQNYLWDRTLATPQKLGNLLIIIRWGKTRPPDLSEPRDLAPVGPDYSRGIYPEQGRMAREHYADTMEAPSNALKDDIRIKTDESNAGILGYDYDLSDMQGLFEVEHERYFVVVTAFDSQIYSKEKKFKELWETRFSVSTHKTNFTKALPMMAKEASDYFGQNSDGLERVPLGHVKVGEPKSLGDVEQPQQ
jgi:hypothetical protein